MDEALEIGAPAAPMRRSGALAFLVLALCLLGSGTQALLLRRDDGVVAEVRPDHP